MPTPEFAAVVLAGGTGARMSGADKAGLELDGRTLLEHALHAVAAATETVVVGDPDPGSPARFVREDPPFGGPAAALLTGLATLRHDWPVVVVLAVDMPRVTPDTVRRLCTALVGHDGAALVDSRARRQLAMALVAERLRAAAPPTGTWQGLPLRKLLAPLDLAEVAAVDDEGRDVDTWADLHDLGG